VAKRKVITRARRRGEGFWNYKAREIIMVKDKMATSFKQNVVGGREGGLR